jgi:hypothetical protein
MLTQTIIKGTSFLIGLSFLVACGSNAQSEDLKSASIGPSVSEPAKNAATVAPTPLPTLSLPDLGLAPDFVNDLWLNTDTPLSLETLEGRVILVEFWTFG